VVDLDGAEGCSGGGPVTTCCILILRQFRVRSTRKWQERKGHRFSHRSAGGARRATGAAEPTRDALAPVHVEIVRRAARRGVHGAGDRRIRIHRGGIAQGRQGARAATAGSSGTAKRDLTVRKLDYSPLFAAGGQKGQAIFSIADQLSAIPQIWQVKDRSDTGCRMRGQIDNMNRVIPGSLIALRDSEGASWTVSVVRWFRRLMVDHVEIGVEYLGRKPRFIKLVAEGDPDADLDFAQKPAPRFFAALYLPPSAQFPTLPIKTILLPASEFRCGGEFTLLSSSATYRMRLNEAISNSSNTC
jgi:hypothetical protein